MPLLADPVAERLLDDTELTSDVCHRSVLVDHERCCVPAELLRVPTTSSARRSILIGHHWHAYLLHEVSGQRGDGQPVEPPELEPCQVDAVDARDEPV